MTILTQRTNHFNFRRLPRAGLQRWLPWLALLSIVGLWVWANFAPADRAVAQTTEHAIVGTVIDEQGTPVSDADILLYIGQATEPVNEVQTHKDGSFTLLMAEDLSSIQSARLVIERPHFAPYDTELSTDQLTLFRQEGALVVPDITLVREFGIAFWITAVTFALLLLLMAFERLHKTLAALLAIAVIFSVSLVGGSLTPDLFIFDFELALEYVDFDVIFLLMGMMIVIGVIEETGIFQWLAYQAYRLSRGRVWLLSLILMTITAVASAMLDNVTTMLLMAPITLQIALAVGVNPLSLLIPEILASNVGGISTLIGTPTNILIGSHAGLSFNDFVVNLTPGVLLAMVGLLIYVQLRYRKEYAKTGGGLSESLLERLRHNAEIKDIGKLTKAGIVFVVLLALFVFGEAIHLPPAVSAIIGAVAMLIWVHPDIEQMMTVVDWTTLIFFIGLFMVIGAVQEVGLIALVASSIGQLVGDSLVIAILTLVWMAALLSGVVDNIPFAAAMLPVTDFLTGTIPGAGNKELYYALSVGAAMGGNSSLIGASANLVTAGIAERAGYPITFTKFLTVGLPSVFVTVSLGCLWLLIHFL